VLKKMLRFVALVLVAGAIVWLTRERLLPEPRVVSDEPRPPFRSIPPAPHAVPDDLTEIKGIGPVFAGRLNDAGIRSFRGLTEMNAAVIAPAIGTTEAVVEDWILQARARLG
jgi:predicted flap endonuclease-1-like 5' DNA nuclease